jgi:hypothetical protein
MEKSQKSSHSNVNNRNLEKCKVIKTVNKRNKLPNEIKSTSCKNDNNRNKLHCFYTNATSLNSRLKLDQFKLLIQQKNKPHLLLITETWFNVNSVSNIPGYKLYAKNREQTSHGGVAIYVRDDINSLEVTVNKEQSESSEQIWCSINLIKEKILVGCIYRPPTARFESSAEINKSIELAKSLVDAKMFDSIIIAGDFNFSDILWFQEDKCSKWKIKGRGKGSRLSRDFISCIEQNLLTQHVLEPTFGLNFLDLVLSDDPARIQEVEIGPPISGSKKNRLHSSIEWDYKLVAQLVHETKVKKFKIFKKGNYECISKIFEDTCALMNDELDVNSLYLLFKSNYSLAVERNIPTKSVKNSSVSRYDLKIKMDPLVKDALKKKHELFAKTRASRNPIVKSNYNKAARNVKRIVKRAREELENQIVEKGKYHPKILYAYMNSQKKCKESIESLKDDNGRITYNRMEIAVLLNRQFQSVYDKRNLSVVANSRLRTDRICILDPNHSFSASNIELYLKNLNTSKSIGIDKIHPYVLKESAASVSKVLSKIFIKSFESGELPTDWKEANVTPIFKKGCKKIPANYRPVSLTSVPCKIMERMIRDIIMKYLLDNDLVHHSQHGFMPGKSCTTNLLETLDSITNSLNENCLVIMVLLDLAKAFDSVPHNVLIDKLKAYGICGNLLDWISSFLKERKQRVVLGETETDWVEVLSGVPQGSVLGPLLFLIFINDLPDELANLCKLFADDTKLLGTVRSNDDVIRIQSDLDALSSWANNSGMSFNINKCKIMKIGKCPPEVTLPIGFTMYDNLKNKLVLEEVSEEKDLGVVWQNNLKWSEHVSRACSMAYMKLGMLRRTFRTWSNARTFKLLFTTCVRPHLEYAVPVWNTLTKKAVKKLEKVQERATRLVPQLQNLSYNERLLNLGLTSLEERRTRGDMIQMFKIQNNFNKVNLSAKNTSCNKNYAQNVGPASSVALRRRASIRLEKEFVKSCTVRESFFTNRVADNWNKLSDETVQSRSVNGFKASYDKFTNEKKLQ